MFIEITTKGNEVILLNVSKILYVLKTKKDNTLIVDVDGNEYSLRENYKDFVERLKQLRKSKMCQNVQNVQN